LEKDLQKNQLKILEEKPIENQSSPTENLNILPTKIEDKNNIEKNLVDNKNIIEKEVHTEIDKNIKKEKSEIIVEVKKEIFKKSPPIHIVKNNSSINKTIETKKIVNTLSENKNIINNPKNVVPEIKNIPKVPIKSSEIKISKEIRAILIKDIDIISKNTIKLKEKAIIFFTKFNDILEKTKKITGKKQQKK